MNKNHILKKFLDIGVGTFISMLIGLLVFPIITRIVVPSELGRMSIFDMYAGIAIMVLCLGLDQAFVRFYYDSNEIDYKRYLLKSCISIPIIAAIIISLIFLLFAVCGKFNFELGIDGLLGLCIYVIIQIIYRFSELIIRLEYESKIYSLLGILNKLIYLFGVLALIQIAGIGHFRAMMISAIFGFIIVLILSVIYKRQYWKFDKSKKKFDVDLKILLKYSYPYVFSMGITTIFQALDRIAINYYCTYEEVGIYSSATSLVNVFSVIQIAFTTLWGPMMIEHYSNNPKDRSLYKRAYYIITAIMFFMGISLILFKDFFVLLAGAKYRDAAYVLPCLIFNPIMYTISETTVCGIIITKKSNLHIVVALGACLVNLIGNNILVPLYGCKGAAISTGISYIVFFSLRTILSNMVFDIKFETKRIYLLSLFVLGYALYNTFYKFNYLVIIEYFVCFMLLVILYKETVIFCINYIKDYFFRKNRL